jgi:hypothetical protein
VYRIHLLILAVVVFGLPCSADPKVDPRDEKPQASTEPKGLPIELSIVGDSTQWELDSRGDPAYKFAENIRNGENSGRLLSPTRAELELEIKNKGATPIKIWVGGDGTLLSLDLKGPGAITLDTKAKPAPGSIPAEVVTIQPGKSHLIPLTTLAHGFRLESKYTYISEIGSYQLSATFTTAVSPAPPESRGVSSGFGEVKLKSLPIVFRVRRPT